MIPTSPPRPQAPSRPAPRLARPAPGGEADVAADASPLGRAPPWERLGFRLASLLAVALLPLGIIGLVEAAAWRDAARDRAAAMLLGETLRATEPTVGLIREATGAATAMAQLVTPLIPDTAACVAAMTALKAASPQYAVAVFVPTSGDMTCGSDGAAFDYGDTPVFRQIVADGFAPMVYVVERGPVSGVSIVLVVQPVVGSPGGPPLGYVGLALPHSALGGPEPEASSLPGERAGGPDTDYLTFNGAGSVLTTSRGYGQEGAILPEGVALDRLATGGAATFEGRTAGGEARDFAVVPLVEGTLYALGSQPARRDFALGPIAAAAPVLTTLLLWAASFTVALWAAERLVTRHLRGLAHAIAAFAGGAREVAPLDLDRAPAEIRAVEQAFLRMTDTILHDEAELEDGLRQREVLLREVHHRSKNNLQLIASIINLQVRRVRSDEARDLMRGLQERVMSLAAVHRELYQSTATAEVRADELLGDIARQVVGSHGGGRSALGLETGFDAMQLAPDQAVPLALLLTEALTQAAASVSGVPDARLRASLRREEGSERAVLLVEALAAGSPLDGSAARTAGSDGDLGDQLIAAFAAQVSGEVERGALAGESAAWRLRVGFPLDRS